jgi:hypothetical protein
MPFNVALPPRPLRSPAHTARTKDEPNIHPRLDKIHPFRSSTKRSPRVSRALHGEEPAHKIVVRHECVIDRRREGSPALPATSRAQGFPARLLQTVRSQLGRAFLTSRQVPVSSSSVSPFEDHNHLERRNRACVPREEQARLSRRVASYLEESSFGSLEPHPLFVGEKEPPISFGDYVVRLVELTNKWVEEHDAADSFGIRCALVAVEYLERLSIRLHSRAIHRYFMICFLLATKLLYDYYFSLSFWAEVSGCPRKSVNAMELLICDALRWRFSPVLDRQANLLKHLSL